jgi:hypothetical protein
MRVSSAFVSLKNLTRLLEVTQFHTGFPALSREARAGREGDNLLRSPAGFLLCFTSHCVKDGEKPSCPLQDSASATSLPTG